MSEAEACFILAARNYADKTAADEHTILRYVPEKLGFNDPVTITFVSSISVDSIYHFFF